MNYTVSNITKLPAAVAASLAELEGEWVQGDLTVRGYLKRKSKLLEPYQHLVTANGSVAFPGGGRGGAGGGEGAGGGGEGEGGAGVGRKLMSVSEDSPEESVKQLNLASDLRRYTVAVCV